MRRSWSLAGMLVACAIAACGGDSAPDHGGSSGSTGRVLGEPPAVSGSWRDAMGDAPWRSVELTPRDARHGRFVGSAACAAPPCPLGDEGDYELDGESIVLRTKKLSGERFDVKIGGDIMEWRKNDVTIRRFERQKPPPRQPPPRDRSYPPRSAKPAPGTACDDMTAAGCLWSPECVLESVTVRGSSASYVCRPAKPPCEGGVAQGDDDFETKCRARAGCTFRPSNCYCPTAHTKVAPALGSDEESATFVNCACGGGPFRQCIAAEAK